jgi:hypothetical protein
MIATHAQRTVLFPFLCSAFLAGVLLLVGGCGVDRTSQAGAQSMTASATPEDLERLTRLRVVFGHQSVGYNVISGIRALAKTQHVSVNFTETREPFADSPGFHHFAVGRNEMPATKIADFDAVMRSGVAQSADVAMMKLCFADFGPQIQPAPEALAHSYIAELEKLSAAYPQTVFVPMTAPLTTAQTGIKAWIKKALGRMPAGYEVNERRQKFNHLLRDHYAGKGVLFDIAELESASGKVSVDYEGEIIPAMNPAYTTDGGHLNALGQQIVGSALVHHLASLPPLR